MKANRLSNRKIAALSKPGVYGDGGTLFMRVREGGSRQWVQIIHIDGERCTKSLGPYPLVSIEDARGRRARDGVRESPEGAQRRESVCRAAAAKERGACLRRSLGSGFGHSTSIVEGWRQVRSAVAEFP